MMFLLKNSEEGLLKSAIDLGVSDDCIGRLLSPGGGSPSGLRRFGIDNGAFANFDRYAFLSLLEKESLNKDRCLFVVSPDVVCSARRTLEVFEEWYSRLQDWPIALACQNGQEDLPIPWNLIDAVFIGGDNEWKMSSHARAIVKAAKALNKWTHVGRVNTPARLEVVRAWGTDSVDGTGISRFTHMREKIANHEPSPSLFTDDELYETKEIA